jgi:hypothetical protein
MAKISRKWRRKGGLKTALAEYLTFRCGMTISKARKIDKQYEKFIVQSIVTCDRWSIRLPDMRKASPRFTRERRQNRDSARLAQNAWLSTPALERLLWNACLGTPALERLSWNACLGTHGSERMAQNAWVGMHLRDSTRAARLRGGNGDLRVPKSAPG